MCHLWFPINKEHPSDQFNKGKQNKSSKPVEAIEKFHYLEVGSIWNISMEN